MAWGEIVRTIVDAAVVSFLVYRLLLLIKGTRAVGLIKGLVFIFLAYLVSNWLGFRMLTWILDNVVTMVFVALPIVFQPELRRALEQLGRGSFFRHPILNLEKRDLEEVVEKVVRAAFELSRRRWGGLIVLERETGLKDFIEKGITLNAVVSIELLVGLFAPDSPLHDGATIVHEDRVVAACCVLPLSDRPYIGKKIGTRHRAALGLAEETDALVIVVSEESGLVSLVFNGIMRTYYDEGSLRERLLKELQLRKRKQGPWWQKFKKKNS